MCRIAGVPRATSPSTTDSVGKRLHPCTIPKTSSKRSLPASSRYLFQALHSAWLFLEIRAFPVRWAPPSTPTLLPESALLILLKQATVFLANCSAAREKPAYVPVTVSFIAPSRTPPDSSRWATPPTVTTIRSHRLSSPLRLSIGRRELGRDRSSPLSFLQPTYLPRIPTPPSTGLPRPPSADPTITTTKTRCPMFRNGNCRSSVNWALQLFSA